MRPVYITSSRRLPLQRIFVGQASHERQHVRQDDRAQGLLQDHVHPLYDSLLPVPPHALHEKLRTADRKVSMTHPWEAA